MNAGYWLADRVAAFAPMCECGGRIWPWQGRMVDLEVGWIHESCASAPEPTGEATEDYTASLDELLDGYVMMRASEIPGDRLLASIQALGEAERGIAKVRASAIRAQLTESGSPDVDA